jgi:hypothetical protein
LEVVDTVVVEVVDGVVVDVEDAVVVEVVDAVVVEVVESVVVAVDVNVEVGDVNRITSEVSSKVKKVAWHAGTEGFAAQKGTILGFKGTV